MQNVLLMCVVDTDGRTPLDIAVYRGHARLVSLIVRVAASQYTPSVSERAGLPVRVPVRYVTATRHVPSFHRVRKPRTWRWTQRPRHFVASATRRCWRWSTMAARPSMTTSRTASSASTSRRWPTLPSCRLASRTRTLPPRRRAMAVSCASLTLVREPRVVVFVASGGHATMPRDAAVCSVSPRCPRQVPCSRTSRTSWCPRRCCHRM